MIRYKQKIYSIREGYYTGPRSEESSNLISAELPLSDLLLPYFSNYIPENKLDYVDSEVRKALAVFNSPSVFLNKAENNSVEFNDDNISNYNISVLLSENKVVLYTFSLDDTYMGRLDSLLNEFCCRFHKMNYTSALLSEEANSYAIYITYSNPKVIILFLSKIMEVLGIKVNVINREILGERPEGEKKVKFYSSDDDAINILNGSSKEVFDFAKSRFRSKEALGYLTLKVLYESLKNAKNKDLALSGKPAPRESFGNEYLLQTLKRLHYVEGLHYTVKAGKVDNNISLRRGVFVVTVGKQDKEKTDKDFWKRLQTKVTRSEVEREIVTYTYFIQSRQEFDTVLNTLLKTGIKFNVYDD